MTLNSKRIAVLAAAIAGVTAITLLTPMAFDGYRDWAAMREATRVDPHPATDADEVAILTEVLEKSDDFRGPASAAASTTGAKRCGKISALPAG